MSSRSPARTDPPSVRFLTERQDYIHAYHALLRTMPWRFRVRKEASWFIFACALGFGGLLLLRLLAALLGRPDALSGPVGWLVLALLVIGARSLLVERTARKYADQRLAALTEQGELHEHRFSIEPDGLRERCVNRDLLHPWSSIERVRRTRTQLHLFTSPLAAHTIPLRAFTTSDSAERFIAAAHEAMAAHRSA